MIYTAEEQAAIIENLKKVKAYAETELIPQLREHEVASACVGNNISFAVRWDGDILFQIGGLCLQFDKEKYPGNNVFDSWTYATRLLLNWKSIKIAIRDKIDQMQKDRKAIIEFEV